MIEFRNQRSEVGKIRRKKMISQNTRRAERFCCVLYACLAKPILDLRLLTFVLCALLFALCVCAEAQEPHKVPRIAYVSSNLAGIPERVAAFRHGLRELGYVEGKNIVIEWRSTGVTRDRQRAFLAELVGLKVEVIVTAGAGATRSAKEVTATIPIVITQDRDPVASGFVASLARPGGNITGLSRLAPDLSGKQVELLTEIVPRLSLLAVFASPTSQNYADVLKEIELAAGALGVKLQHLDVQSPKDFETAFREASKRHADAALWLVSDPVYNSHRTQVAELAVKARLPVIFYRRVDVEAGGLISYGVNFTDLDRRAAYYVDKILKGAKPADLPVEQPKKFEFVINLKTAKQIGLTIPPHVLARADKVIR
jgi:putative ABC transport system substrate-binding protein